jgi:hypothetical protein
MVHFCGTFLKTEGRKGAFLSREGGVHFKVAGRYRKGHKSLGERHISQVFLAHGSINFVQYDKAKLDEFLENQCSPTHMQGTLALSIHLVGSVATLCCPF